MSLKLPPANSPIRELFDTADLAERAAPARRNKLPTLPAAKAQAAAVFAMGNRSIHSVNYIVLRASGEIHLVTFGPKGGFRVRWNFGQ